jgi:hypothetical protein
MRNVIEGVIETFEEVVPLGDGVDSVGPLPVRPRGRGGQPLDSGSRQCLAQQPERGRDLAGGHLPAPLDVLN